MTVTLAGSIQCDTAALIAAFKAVLPHAAPNKTGDDVTALHRVRLVIDDYFVNVAATSGPTMALARAGIEDDDRPTPADDDDGPYVIDLPPVAIRRLVTVFKPKPVRRQDAAPSDGRLELAFTPDRLEVIEGPGGLFPLQSMSFPLDEINPSFPDVLQLLGRAVREAGADTAAKPLIADALRLFEQARKVYGQPLRISGTGTAASPAWLVEVGAAFVGSFGSKVVGDDDVKIQAAWRQAWAKSLPPALKAAG